MSELEDAGSGCRQGSEEQDCVFQPEHDGGVGAGPGIFSLRCPLNSPLCYPRLSQLLTVICAAQQ
jgi:hypothetical protein